ncbi:MAG: tetratricopeptide repeat protein [Endomicrobiales bacterium]|nr:tetratricopeptide repeat protein [Endomicrobiales bacterium]
MKKYIIWTLIIAGILVRLLYFSQVKDEFLFKTPILDAKYYHEWAIEIADGDIFGKNRGVFMMSPGYSYFLAFVYSVLGNASAGVVLIQFLLGIATAVLVYLLGKRLFSETTGIVAMALYLFYSPALFYESTLLKTSLINFLNTLALYLLSAGGPAAIVFSGIATGFSIHLRPNAALIALLAAAWILIKYKRKSYVPVLMFVAGLSIMLLPVGIRNLAVGGEFAFSTAHGGMNFYTGNSKHCLGPYTPMPFARTDPEVEQDDFIKEASKRAGRTLSPAESSNFWFGEAKKEILADPGRWLNLLARKALVFFNGYETPINLDYYFFKNEYRSMLSYLPVRYGILLPLAAGGIVLAPLNALFAGYLALYFISGIIFFVVSEYRFPVVPLLCIYAGVFLAEGVKRVMLKNNVKTIITPLAVFTAFLLLANVDIYSKLFGFDTYKKSNLSNSYFGMGVTYEQNGMSKKAEDTYRRAIAIMPQTGPLVNLAGILEDKGEIGEAERIYKFAIRTNPGAPEAYNNLGTIYYKKGDYAAAKMLFGKAMETNPDFEPARRNFEAAVQAAGGR